MSSRLSSTKQFHNLFVFDQFKEMIINGAGNDSYCFLPILWRRPSFRNLITVAWFFLRVENDGSPSIGSTNERSENGDAHWAVSFSQSGQQWRRAALDQRPRPPCFLFEIELRPTQFGHRFEPNMLRKACVEALAWLSRAFPLITRVKRWRTATPSQTVG